MTVDVFIRSYRGDFDWLIWCLRSLAKYLNDAHSVTIAVPTEDMVDATNISNLRTLHSKVRVRVVPWTPVHSSGYIDQQVCKLHADLFCNADFITFVDSDTVLTRPFSVMELFGGGNKPKLPYTGYQHIYDWADKLKQDRVPWQRSTEEFIRGVVAYEFMRRQFLTYPKEVLGFLRVFCRDMHGYELSQYFSKVNEISEFNILGAYSNAFHIDKFEWQNTEDPKIAQELSTFGAKQYWSWGKITPEIQRELILNIGEEVS
jgi:hypothetical protein